jgi:hypothetical protein
MLDKTIDADQDARVIAAAERFAARHNLRLAVYGDAPDAYDYEVAVGICCADSFDAGRLGRLWAAALCRALRVRYDRGITLHRDSGTGVVRIAYYRSH